MKDAITAGGKTIQLVVDKKSAALRFQFSPGGELPEELSGIFTQERYAVAALSAYQDRMKPKEKK